MRYWRLWELKASRQILESVSWLMTLAFQALTCPLLSLMRPFYRSGLSFPFPFSWKWIGNLMRQIFELFFSLLTMKISSVGWYSWSYFSFCGKREIWIILKINMLRDLGKSKIFDGFGMRFWWLILDLSIHDSLRCSMQLWYGSISV